MSEPDAWTWRQLLWTRPLDPARAAAVLRHWATFDRGPRIAIETSLTKDGAVYRIGCESRLADAVLAPLRAWPNVSLRPDDSPRPKIITAGHLQANTRHRPLRLNDPEAVVRAVLGMIVRLRRDETVHVQVVLGPRRIPEAVPSTSPSSVIRPWWSVAWLGDGDRIEGEARSALRTKLSDHGFACTVRLGVDAAEPERRKALILGLLAGLRVSEAPGIQLRLHREPANRFETASAPWIWPLRLGVPELVGLMAWPLGESDLPGQPPAHPKLLPAARAVVGTDRILADSAVPGSDEGLSLPIKYALHHLHVLGPTGVGKSTLLVNSVLHDIASGLGVVVIDPKGDAVKDILERVSPERRDDVVVLDPNDAAPVGLNPLSRAGRRPELVADAMLATLKQLYGKNIGPRSADILSAGLLTLAHHEDASLVMLPLLYTNPGFRRSMTATVRDPLTLDPFWSTFENWSDAERAAAVAPVMNKLRPILRPGLRAVLGQRAPRFDIGQVLTERKILLVPLQRGVIGPDAAALLGSLVVAALWQAVQGRAAVPTRERHPVSVVIDEAQNYLHLPTDLGDALAQARGYGVAFTLAHQFLEQFPKEMRSAVLANARSRVAFQLAHDDARILERGHPELAAADFEALGKYEVYASLFANGQVQPFASGRTRPLGPKLVSAAELRAQSRTRYGRPLDEIEAGFAALLDSVSQNLGPTGRQRRTDR